MNEEEKRVLMNGYHHYATERFTKKDVQLSYKAHNHNSPYAYGWPITGDVGRLLIKNYNPDEEYALDFGKEALLSILSQNNCQGVRFYFGMRKLKNQPNDENSSKDDISWDNTPTLIAIGTEVEDGKLKEIGDLVNAIGPIPSPTEPNPTPQVHKITQTGMIREIVPPANIQKILELFSFFIKARKDQESKKDGKQ